MNDTTERTAAATELRDSMMLMAVVLLLPMLIVGLINLIALL